MGDVIINKIEAKKTVKMSLDVFLIDWMLGPLIGCDPLE
jgi:hypothetical protein